MLSDGDLLGACASQVGSVTSTELHCSMFSEVENPTMTKPMQMWGCMGYSASKFLY